jgi:hypothetical protein
VRGQGAAAQAETHQGNDGGIRSTAKQTFVLAGERRFLYEAACSTMRLAAERTRGIPVVERRQHSTKDHCIPLSRVRWWRATHVNGGAADPELVASQTNGDASPPMELVQGRGEQPDGRQRGSRAKRSGGGARRTSGGDGGGRAGYAAEVSKSTAGQQTNGGDCGCNKRTAQTQKHDNRNALLHLFCLSRCSAGCLHRRSSKGSLCFGLQSAHAEPWVAAGTQPWL